MAANIIPKKKVDKSVPPSNSRRTETVQNAVGNQRGTSHEKELDDTNAKSLEMNVEMRPFDICNPVTASFKLKPSILDTNRAIRKENESRRNVPHLYLNPGMVLLKNFISATDQIKIVEKCRDLGLGPGGFYIPGYTDGSKLQLRMMCLGKNWDPESKYENIRRFDGAVPPKVPDDFAALVSKAMSAAFSFMNDAKKDIKELPNMSPDLCIVNFYNRQGKLGLHQDKDESQDSITKGLPVVSISLGDSAEFHYGKSRDIDKADKVVLESGDVLIFGGSSRLIFHGVSAILPKTAPKWFTDKSNMKAGRLNLTFRKY